MIAAVFAANAVVSELYQARPGSGRSGDPSDAVADLVGIALGWLAFRLAARPLGRRAAAQSGRRVSVADPEPGDLLVASALLTDGVFDQTVVLVLDSDEDGALGVILNEISQTTLESVLPDWVSVVSEPRLLFHGGPVSPNGAICLASVAEPGEEPPGWRPVFDRIGLLHLDTPIELVTGGAYADLRIFAGYAGWSPGQLAGEVAQQMWHVVQGRVRRRLRSAADRAVAPGAASAAQRAGLLRHLGGGPGVELSTRAR